ncbi:MAG: hypothetical protein LBB41_06660 [Prevotellaceae bacterium]|nr:hypothetical protein [Prevotellaceae bacterium]
MEPGEADALTLSEVTQSLSYCLKIITSVLVKSRDQLKGARTKARRDFFDNNINFFEILMYHLRRLQIYDEFVCANDAEGDKKEEQI